VPISTRDCLSRVRDGYLKDRVDEFVARNRADGEPSFTIRPPGWRPVYYVTVFSYPRIPSSSALGADARATPSVLATLERARDTGATTMSNQTTLPGDLELPAAQRPVAFELSVPVYGIELRPDATVAERRRWFAGRPGSSEPATSSTRR
jgi:CHASE domain